MTTAESATDLLAALRELGCDGAVEMRGGMAILTLSEEQAAVLADGVIRDQILRLGRRYGFTHLAVEIVADHAAVSRD